LSVCLTQLPFVHDPTDAVGGRGAPNAQRTLNIYAHRLRRWDKLRPPTAFISG